MKWRKYVEYRTELSVNEEIFSVFVRKNVDEEFFEVQINNDYIGDTATIPTHEELREMIEEQKEIEAKVDEGLSRRL